MITARVPGKRTGGVRPCAHPFIDGGIAVFSGPSERSLAELARIESEPLCAVGAKCAVAFGSYARNVAEAWSNLDLVVVMEPDIQRLERGRLLDELYDALAVSLDILLFIPAELEREA